MLGLGLSLSATAARRVGPDALAVPLWQIFGLRKQLASGASAMVAAYQYQRVRTLVGYTDGVAIELSSSLMNGHSAPGGIIGNVDSLTVERFGYIVGGTLYASITSPVILPGVGPGVNASILNTPSVTIPATHAAGLPIYEEVVYCAATATSRIPMVQSPYAYCLAGEGYETGTASRASNFGAAIAQNNNLYIGRFMSSATWRRSTTRFNDGVLKLNDSIGQGAASPFHAYDARGNVGFLQQFLDSPTGGRRQYLDFGMYATSIGTQDPAASWESPVELLRRILADLGPFHIPIVACQHGHNDAGGGFATMRAGFIRLRDYVRANLGNPRWVQFGCTGRTTSTDSFTSLAGQSAQSAAWSNAAGTFKRQTNDWFAAGADGYVDAFIPHHLAIEDADGIRFLDATAKGTLATAVGANATNIVVVDTTAGLFKLGQLLAFEPLDGTNGDVHAGYNVATITGSGPQKTMTLRDPGPFDRKVQKAHAAGAAVSSRISPDGEHFPADYHDLMRDYALPLKAAAFTL